MNTRSDLRTSSTLDHREQVRVQVVHPHAALLAHTGSGVAGTWADVRCGDWGSLARLCGHRDGGEKVPDLGFAEETLADAAARSGFTFADRTEVEGTLRATLLPAAGGEDVSAYELVGDEGEIVAALDLFMRLLCGQWDEVDWLCSTRSQTPRGPGWEPMDLNWLRGVVCRTFTPGALTGQRRLRPEEFPGHANASVGIAESVPVAKIAYHAYKLLGGGAAGGPTFAAPGGPVIVRVDGVEVNRIRAY